MRTHPDCVPDVTGHIECVDCRESSRHLTTEVDLKLARMTAERDLARLERDRLSATLKELRRDVLRAWRISKASLDT